MGIIESGVRRTDIMPSLEAQREASEIKVNLAPQQFVCVGEAGIVEIKGGEQCGLGRNFTISKPKGVAFTTNGRIVPEVVEA